MKKEFQRDQLPDITKMLLEKAGGLSSNKAVVIALSGELGAGKTTLTQRLGALLGVKENMISPTFVIMKKYKTNDEVFTTMVHIDAYRLNTSEELRNLGWSQLIADPHTLIVLEWPERVPECLKEATVLRCTLMHVSEDTRQIEFN